MTMQDDVASEFMALLAADDDYAVSRSIGQNLARVCAFRAGDLNAKRETMGVMQCAVLLRNGAQLFGALSLISYIKETSARDEAAWFKLGQASQVPATEGGGMAMVEAVFHSSDIVAVTVRRPIGVSEVRTRSGILT